MAIEKSDKTILQALWDALWVTFKTPMQVTRLVQGETFMEFTCEGKKYRVEIKEVKQKVTKNKK